MIVKKIKRYSVEMCENNPKCLFIFGCNLLKVGLGGQAIIRKCPNAYGIPTKKLPSQLANSYFSDSDYEENIEHIKKAIDEIPTNYKAIIFPTDGLGTGLADLPNKAPKTYAFLNKYINSKFGDVYEE